MTQDKTIEKSLVELILEEMFARLGKREEFDNETVQNLKELSAAGDLKKADSVMEVLKAKQS